MDPFRNDPFFRDPFATMNAMSARMDAMMQQAFSGPFFAAAPGGFGAAQGMSRLPPVAPGPSATVEELRDGEGADMYRSGSVPFVEEPDDDDDLHATRHNKSTAQQNMETTQGRHLGATRRHRGGDAAADNGPTYAFCSSSVYSNVNGQTYQQSSNARMGPGRVREMTSTVNDGRTGKQSISVMRGLGDRAHTMTRLRDASGQETANDVFNGIQQAEAGDFDQQWMQRAQQAFPGGMGMTGRRAISSSQRSQHVLPSADMQRR